jgi:hypothetical protein
MERDRYAEQDQLSVGGAIAGSKPGEWVFGVVVFILIMLADHLDACGA